MKKKYTPFPEICITGLGLATSVGHDHRTACASIRSGLKRPKPLKMGSGEDGAEGNLVFGHPVLDLKLGNMGDRMFTLLAMALKDLKQTATLDTQVMEDCYLYLALPEPERLNLEHQDVHGLIRAHWHRDFLESGFRMYIRGHTGMIVAIVDAARAIHEGFCRRVLVAGADSMIGDDDLLRFDARERLKTERNRVGFMPGEASSAILVESVESARMRNAGIRCLVRGAVVDQEDLSIVSGRASSGEGMVRAITGLCDGGANTPLSVAAVVSDMNGEPYRFGEWGMIQARYMNGVNGEKNVICPAKNIGDTGAASPGVGVCVAVGAMERGYLTDGPGNRAGQALILSSSDDGERGALLVSGNPAYGILN